MDAGIAEVQHMYPASQKSLLLSFRRGPPRMTLTDARNKMSHPIYNFPSSHNSSADGTHSADPQTKPLHPHHHHPRPRLICNKAGILHSPCINHLTGMLGIPRCIRLLCEEGRHRKARV